MNISKMVRKRRIELGLSQDELANMLGYKSRSSINKLEQGKTDIPQSKIIQLAKALSCSPAYLMGWEEKTAEHSAPLQLTKKENKLISDFRSLSEQGQDYVIQTMDMVKERYRKETHKPEYSFPVRNVAAYGGIKTPRPTQKKIKTT